jgi:Arylsulfotransferase (ASST)
MGRIDVAKFLFCVTCTTTVLGLSFGFGLYSGANKTAIYEVVSALKNTVEGAFKTTTEEASTLSKIRPKHFLQPARYEGTGVTVNDIPNAEAELILLSGFFEDTNELRLIRRNGDIVARWSVHFSAIFFDTSHVLHPPATDWNVDIHGALILPDGAVVFNFEYMGLVKLDRCGSVVWTLARQSHHSVERAEGGGFWVPGRRFFPRGSNSPFPPFEPPFREDTVMKVSENGTVLAEFSVPKLFYDNGLESLLTATGESFKTGLRWDNEIVHLNKIDELTSDVADDFSTFESGDLALSIREFNLVMVIDPDTGQIKWWRVGPWVRQHDPEFIPGGKLIVFNNNNYRTAFGEEYEVSPLSPPRLSNIVEIDPTSNEHRIIYGDGHGQRMFSILRGKHERTPNGGLLITEFEGGRVFETDAAGRVVWEYINRYSSTEVAEVTEARLYPASYFNVSDWSCKRPGELANRK